MKKLRLLLFKDCKRNCKGCCNNEWDLDRLPIETEFTGYDEILLTGGEPMLKPKLVLKTIDRIRQVDEGVAIYMYTAKVNPIKESIKILGKLTGITITLHEQKDVNSFLKFAQIVGDTVLIPHAKFRVNIFRSIDIHIEDITCAGFWVIRKNITWKKNCPLPRDEVFKRL